MTITERIDNITQIPEGNYTGKIDAPPSVKIELTARCNYRCQFCALTTRAKQPGVVDDMDFDFFCRITSEMMEAGVEEIGLFYIGESMMNMDLLIESLKWLKAFDKPPMVFLTTNGSLATKHNVKQLMYHGLDSLKFSVTSSDPVQFSKVVGVKPKLFWNALNNIKLAAEARGSLNMTKEDCEISASSIRYGEKQDKAMQPILDRFVRPYVDKHYWLPLYTMGDYATHNELKQGMNPTAGNMGRLEAMRDPLPCWLTVREGHVTAKGLMSACGFDANDSWIVADLNEVSFMDGWNNKEFRDLRKAHFRKDVTGTICEQCILYQEQPQAINVQPAG